MPSAFALGIFSGKIIFNCALPGRLRSARKRIFTGRVVEENGSCSAAFCESVALRKNICGSAPSPSSLRDATSPKGRGKSNAGNFLVIHNTLVTGFKSWLSLRESWRGSA